MFSVRKYDHSVLREVILAYPGADQRSLLVDDLVHIFPLRLLVVLGRSSESLSDHVHLALVARLRAKGYRLTICFNDRSGARRRALRRALQRYFMSLGETNFEVSDAEPSRIAAAGFHAVLTAEAPQGHWGREVTAQLPALHPTALEESDLWRSYFQRCVLEPFVRITRFNRPFHPQRIEDPELTRPTPDFWANVDNFCAEMRSRLSFKRVIPEPVIDIASPRWVAAAQDEDAVTIGLRLRQHPHTGLTLERIAELTDHRFPRILRALRKLVGAGLATRVGDRFFAAGFDPTGMDPRPSTTPAAAPASPALGSVDRDGIQISVHFPPGVFGYDTTDGDKCTGVRMIQAGEAALCEEPPPGVTVLDPTGDTPLTEKDLPMILERGICLIDTPWYLLPETSLALEARGRLTHPRHLRLPEQSNAYYAGSSKVSTAGAASWVAALAGCPSQARRILDLFEWGERWWELIQAEVGAPLSQAAD
jgi:ribosome biogenesis protein Tsr3